MKCFKIFFLAVFALISCSICYSRDSIDANGYEDVNIEPVNRAQELIDDSNETAKRLDLQHTEVSQAIERNISEIQEIINKAKEAYSKENKSTVVAKMKLDMIDAIEPKLQSVYKRVRDMEAKSTEYTEKLKNTVYEFANMQNTDHTSKQIYKEFEAALIKAENLKNECKTLESELNVEKQVDDKSIKYIELYSEFLQKKAEYMIAHQEYINQSNLVRSKREIQQAYKIYRESYVKVLEYAYNVKSFYTIKAIEIKGKIDEINIKKTPLMLSKDVDVIGSLGGAIKDISNTTGKITELIDNMDLSYENGEGFEGSLPEIQTDVTYENIKEFDYDALKKQLYGDAEE